MSGHYSWNHLVPRDLARVVDPRDLPVELRLAEVNRLDLLERGGPESIAAQVYAAIAASGVNYELEPLSQIRNEQRIRMPRKILSDKRATCLDLAVLFAAACLQQELLSVLVLLEDHALAGIALLKTQRDKDTSFSMGVWKNGLLDDLAAAKSLIRSGELLVVECTGMVSSQSLRVDKPEGQGRENGKLTFEQACQVGAAQILDHAVSDDTLPSPRQRRFQCLLNIHELQTQQGFAPDPVGSATERERVAAQFGQVVEKLTTVGGDAQEILTRLAVEAAERRRLSALPVGYDSVVADFLDYYLGAPEEPEPFGGREAVLADLTRWLDDRTVPRYAVLEAPAGRGKSAVVAHWVASLAGRSDWAVAFVPISERFDSNAASAIFQTLYGRLVYLHGETPTRQDSTEDYRVACREYLRKPLPDGRRLLVVLDGLDEAVGWGTKTGLFPTKAPDHLKVLVAARTIAGDQSWLEQLGWTGKRQARVFGLDNLTRSGVQEVLHRKGDPLGGMADSDGLLDKLYHLTQQGDPLLVRLYVDALRTDQRQESELTPGDLDRIEPGLDGYFKDWYPRQQAMWEKGKEQVDKDAVAELLNLRAMAHGPLSAQDVFMLAPVFFRTPEAVQRTAEAVRRFLIGDGSRDRGYSFNHPRFTEYFRSKLEPVRQLEYQRRYLAYGAETLQSLNAGTLPPGATSRYIVRNYRVHLEESSRPTGELCALMSKGWLRAWRTLEGMEAGFLDDVQAAMDRAAKAGPEWLGQVIRGALCCSSVRSLSYEVKPELLASAILRGVLPLRIGLYLARNKPHTFYRSRAISIIADGCDRPQRGELLAEALAATREIGDERVRTEALKLVAERLPVEELGLLAKALEVVRGFHVEEQRAEALSVVAKRLPVDALNHLTEALAIVRKIHDEHPRSLALSAVVERLPAEAQTLLAEALAIACRIKDEQTRAFAVGAVVEQLPLDAPELLAEALSEARKFENDFRRGDVLNAVMQRMSSATATLLFAEVIAVVRITRTDFARAKALSTLTARLSVDAKDHLNEILMTARADREPECRADVLVAVARRLAAKQTHSVLIEALTAARGIDYAARRAEVLIAVAELLPTDEARGVLAEALAAARGIRNEWNGPETLIAVMQRLPADDQDLLTDALEVARGIGNKWGCARALGAVSERLPEKKSLLVLDEALEVARQIEDAGIRIRALSYISTRLPADRSQKVMAEALASIGEIEDEAERVSELQDVVERLPTEAPNLLARALAIARRIEDEAHRVEALRAVVNRFPANAQGLFLEALAAVREIRDEAQRAAGLVVLADQSPTDALDFLSEVMGEARALANKQLRANALGIVAEKLPPAEAVLVLSDALALASEIGDGSWRAPALGDLATELPVDEARLYLAEALDVVCDISDDVQRADALTTLVEDSLLGDEQELLDKALAVANGIKNEEARVEALLALSRRLVADAAKPVLADALTTTLRTGNDWLLVKVLSESIKRWPDGSSARIHEAREVAHRLQDGEWRILALMYLADVLNDNDGLVILAEALQMARRALNDEILALVLVTTAERFPIYAPDLLAEALEAARGIVDRPERAGTLMLVADLLPPDRALEVLTEARTVARDIDDVDQRSLTLIRMAERMPAEAPVLVAEALAAARTYSDEVYLDLLCTQAKKWHNLAEATHCTDGDFLVRTFCPAPSVRRSVLLNTLAGLAHQIFQIGGIAALREVHKSIRETAEWWP